MLVSVFSDMGMGLVSFLISFLYRIMCIGYLIAICEKDSIRLWILELGICGSRRSSTIVVCIVFLIHAMVIMGGSTSTLVGIGVGGEWRI